MKPEFKDKRFFRPEPLRSKKDQTIIDENYKKLKAQNKARLIATQHPYTTLDKLLILYQDMTKMEMKLKGEPGFVLMLDRLTKH